MYDFKPKDSTFLGDIKAQISIRFLGEVPIELDGSWAARVPVNTPVTFQVINYKGKVINQMPIWLAGTAGEVQRCGGCHADVERREGLADSTIALSNPIKILDTPHDLDFGRDIAPMLHDACSSCHGPGDQLDLSNSPTLFRTTSWRSLAALQRGRFGMPGWRPFRYGSEFYAAVGGVDSFLLSLLDGDVREGKWNKVGIPYAANGQQTDRIINLRSAHTDLLTPEQLNLLARWTSFPSLLGTPFYRHIKGPDNNAYPNPSQDLWPAAEQALKNKCAGCHVGNATAETSPSFTTKTHSSKVFVKGKKVNGIYSTAGINSNFKFPELSPLLRLPTGQSDLYKTEHPTIWNPSSPEYQAVLQWIESGKVQ